MDKESKIYVAGHRGLVGSAIMRQLKNAGYHNTVTRTHAELDLTEQQAVRDFFSEEKPGYVFLCAAKVGGILANNTYPAEFIHKNLAIQTNVIHESYLSGVERLLFLGSSCIYPRDCPQPMKEEYLLTGPLEPTNRPYAIAKIAGIEMCWAYNRQYGTHYLAVMPTNLFGPGDNYDLEASHVLPALIRKMHEAKESSADNVVVWGTGSPRREFLYSDDLGAAAIYLMDLESGELDGISLSVDSPPLINIGVGKDLTIKELAEMVREIVGFNGDIVWDIQKPDGTPRKLLDVSKIKSLGWESRVSLKSGIDAAYKDYLECFSI
ncbi:MAG: GDP-L-fucose synthase [Acidithiobacillales bacterium SG8_45]|nr:MAG: GDP-L-fucose synthase [Acidithiobacillales bacterium SG8_45]